MDKLQHQFLTLNQAPALTVERVRMAEAGLGFSVFTSRPWLQERPTALAVYKAVLAYLGSKAFTYFGTENMSKHRKVTAATLDMLPCWLEDGAPAREFVALELKGGATPADASATQFNIFGAEPTYDEYEPLDALCLFVSLLPGQRALEEDAKWIEQMFMAVCARVQLVSAIAGPVIIRSRYASSTANHIAWKTAMRYKGLDIQTLISDGMAVSEQGLKGIGWLTALGNPVLDSLGGRQQVLAALPKAVRVTELPTGVVLKLADWPSLLDSNRPDDSEEVYRATYRVLQPAIEYYIRRSSPLDINENERENSDRWYRRFGDT